jgi:hypothetical protein
MALSKLGSAGLDDRQARIQLIHRIQGCGQIWQEETTPDLYQEALAMTWREIFDHFSVLSIDLTIEYFNEHLKKNYGQLKRILMG